MASDPRNDLVLKQALYEACEGCEEIVQPGGRGQISCAIQGAMRQITVTRSTFESLTEDLIDG